MHAGYHGNDIEAPKSTGVTHQRESSHILFGGSILIQTPLEELPQETAIFFEFQHYKPSKKKVSTKCFSFMEMDEIKPGKAALEMYALCTFNRILVAYNTVRVCIANSCSLCSYVPCAVYTELALTFLTAAALYVNESCTIQVDHNNACML